MPHACDPLPSAVRARIKDHPCFSEQAHHHHARMHVPVASTCNVQCNYCNRKFDCTNESRPGVTSSRLTPRQALEKVLETDAALPNLSVVGIAGPGDALANPAETFGTLALLHEHTPHLKLCLSTNGLDLLDYVTDIVRYGVEHVTVTINTIDPDVGAAIYAWVRHKGERLTGRAAAELLIERQLAGLSALVLRNVLVKVNTVLIPGVNDADIVALNAAIRERGAFLHNIMPLISEIEHGTAFAKTGQRGPTAGELREAQESCGGGARLMHHCRQCRADAVGLLGQDQAEVLPLQDIDHRKTERAARREALRTATERERRVHEAIRAEVAGELAALGRGPAVRVAVASAGGGRVNQHFGHAKEFQIYEVSPAGIRFVGYRRIERYCRGGDGDDERLPGLLKALDDCHAVLVARIGGCPRQGLETACIEVADDHAHDFIEEAALAWYRDYLGRLARGEVRHRPRGDYAASLTPAA